MKLGVIVGRFQTPYLHVGHMHLLTTAMVENDHVLVVIGDREAQATRKHPLTFIDRAAMFQKFPNVKCVRLVDVPSDADWDANLDKLITQRAKELTEFEFESYSKQKPAYIAGHKPWEKQEDGSTCSYACRVILYGSRDSFIEKYSGLFTTQSVPTISGISATKIREDEVFPTFSEDYRRGVIQATKRRFPTSYQCVDVIPYCPSTERVLFGKKKIYGNSLIFVGGHVDPVDASLEVAALRELKEETGISITGTPFNTFYVGSGRVPDYRYAGTEDGIMTSLFVCIVAEESAVAGDDLDAVEWVDFRAAESRLASVHAALWSMVLPRIHIDFRNYGITEDDNE